MVKESPLVSILPWQAYIPLCAQRSQHVALVWPRHPVVLNYCKRLSGQTSAARCANQCCNMLNAFGESKTYKTALTRLKSPKTKHRKVNLNMWKYFELILYKYIVRSTDLSKFLKLVYNIVITQKFKYSDDLHVSTQTKNSRPSLWFKQNPGSSISEKRRSQLSSALKSRDLHTQRLRAHACFN